MDCFTVHQSYKKKEFSEALYVIKKSLLKKIFFLFRACVKPESAAKKECIQSHFLFSIELRAPNMFNTRHFALEKLAALSVCVCVHCCTAKGSLEERGSLSVCHQTQAAKFYEIPNY